MGWANRKTMKKITANRILRTFVALSIESDCASVRIRLSFSCLRCDGFHRHRVRAVGHFNCATDPSSSQAGCVFRAGATRRGFSLCPALQWLSGDGPGWRGAWGITYAANLRLYFDKISEDQWVKIARSLETRPPMPWFALRDMTESDLRDSCLRRIAGTRRRTRACLCRAGQGTQAPIRAVPVAAAEKIAA